MQSSPLSNKQLFAISGLIVFCALLLALSIMSYNTTFFVSEKREANQSTKAQVDIIPISAHDPILGNPAAPITVIGFEDFLCETCRIQHQLMTDLLTQYEAQVKFIWKDLSISTIPVSSELAHVYGYCMNEQNLFDVYKTAIYSQIFTEPITTTLLDSLSSDLGANLNKLTTCVQSDAPIQHIEKNKLLAQALQIQHVPTFFVNGNQIPTPSTLSDWITTLHLNQ